MDEITIKQKILPWVDPVHTIKPTGIVLHWWGEPINNDGIDYLVRILEKRQLSVQFAVLASGDIYQLSPTPNSFCRHAKCANDTCIGIEIEGLNRFDLDANQKQYESVLKLTSYLKQKYRIADDFHVDSLADPMRFYGINSHKVVDTYCVDASGKDDVHDEYVERVVTDLASR